jgi:Ca2+-transporting ATPase
MLLWVNLLTDGFPALALGIDKAAPDIMERKPRNKKEGILSRKLIYQICIAGSVLAFTLLIVFLLGLPMGLATAQTMVFTGFVIFEFVRIAAIRRAEKISFFSNKWLLLALAGSILMQFIVIYSPLNVFFGTVPLGLYSWEVLIAGAFICWILWIGIMKVLEK